MTFFAGFFAGVFLAAGLLAFFLATDFAGGAFFAGAAFFAAGVAGFVTLALGALFTGSSDGLVAGS